LAEKSFQIFQVDEMYREAPIKHGMFDYIEFTRILKHGAKDKDDQ
jgi:myosin regulatory light chain 12